MAEISVVFLGGPVDGMEMVLSSDPVEFRFAQNRGLPLPAIEDDPQQPLPVSYVAYRKTRRTVRGRRVYSLVTA